MLSQKCTIGKSGVSTTKMHAKAEESAPLVTSQSGVNFYNFTSCFVKGGCIGKKDGLFSFLGGPQNTWLE